MKSTLSLQSFPRRHAVFGGGGAARLYKRCTTEQGASIVEAIIAMLVLAIAALASISTFSSYVVNASNARLRDGITAVITQDVERLRYQAAQLWKCTPSSISSVCTTAASQGGLTEAYAPPPASCSADSLASAANSADSTFPTAQASSTLSISSASATALRNPTITRTITPSGNIIKLTYSSTSPIPVTHVAYILPEAQVWCPQ